MSSSTRLSRTPRSTHGRRRPSPRVSLGTAPVPTPSASPRFVLATSSRSWRPAGYGRGACGSSTFPPVQRSDAPPRTVGTASGAASRRERTRHWSRCRISSLVHTLNSRSGRWRLLTRTVSAPTSPPSFSSHRRVDRRHRHAGEADRPSPSRTVAVFVSTLLLFAICYDPLRRAWDFRGHGVRGGTGSRGTACGGCRTIRRRTRAGRRCAPGCRSSTGARRRSTA